MSLVLSSFETELPDAKHSPVSSSTSFKVPDALRVAYKSLTFSPNTLLSPKVDETG